MWDVRRLPAAGTVRPRHHRGGRRGPAPDPSSVSQQLTQLEREVGLPLLRKSGRGVQLTQQAEILVEHTEAILQRLSWPNRTS